MIKGSCLCGNVRVEIEEPLEHAPEACHCTQCRKQSGHFLVAVNVRRTALRILGAEFVKWFQSSEKVKRGFCSVCGSTLFWDPIFKDWIGIAMGAFEGPTATHLAKHIFVAEKGDYYEISDGLPQYEH